MNDTTQLLATEAQSLETIFTLLRDRRRRHVVAALSEQDPPIALYDLVTPVAARETGMDPDDVSADAIDELVTALHHVHLPKLDDAGFVDYDAETNRVTTVRTAALTAVLEAVRR